MRIGHVVGRQLALFEGPERPIVTDALALHGLRQHGKGILPDLLGFLGVDLEGRQGVEIVGARSADLGASARDDIERCKAFGNDQRMVPLEQDRAHHAQLDVLGLPRDGSIEHFGGADGKAGRAELLLGGSPDVETPAVGLGHFPDHFLVTLGVADARHHLPLLQHADLHHGPSFLPVRNFFS